MTGFIESGLVWWTLAAFVLLVLMSHIAWWSKRAYFPNHTLCEDAHDRFHLSVIEKEGFGGDKEAKKQAEDRFWHSIAFRLISQVPGDLSISGLFCTLIWPVFVVLNVLLLAQVVGTLVGSGGGVIDIYPFGTYGAIPLVTAVLYAVAQTVFGIMYGEVDRKDKKRYLVLLLLVLAIFLEGGLAVYRAWLIRGGDATAGANLIDSTLAGRFGLVVGAFFGILFPSTHAALGYVGYPQFVSPAVRYVLRLMGGLSVLALAIANYFLLAWHPMHPKDRADEERMAEEARRAAQKEKDEEAKLAAQKEKDEEAKRAALKAKDEAAKAAQEAELQRIQDSLTPEERHYWIQQVKLADEARDLSECLEDLYARVPATPAEVKQTIEAASKLRRRWSKIAGDAANLMAEASRLDVDQLAVMAAKFATSNSEAPDTDATQRGADASNSSDEEELRKKAVLDEAIESGKTRLGPLYVLANTHDKLVLAIKEIGRLQRDLYYQQANTEGREILDKAKKLRGEFPEMERLLKGKDSNGSELGLDMRFKLYKARLDALNRGFAAIPPPQAGNPRFGDYQRLELLVDRCRTLFQGLEDKINAGLSIQAEKGMQVNKEKLDAIPKELSGAYVTTLRALEDAKKILNERLKKVESRPRWFYTLADLVA
jgi:hypothetical protein